MRLIEFDSKQISTMGEVATLMTRSPAYLQYPIACLTEWLEPAIILDQIRVFKDEAGILCGYATWAFLSEDTERRLVEDSQVLLHLSEWNEGNHIWIMDLLCVHGEVRALVADLFKQFPGATEAKSLRRREDGSVRKVVTWRRRIQQGADKEKSMSLACDSKSLR